MGIEQALKNFGIGRTGPNAGDAPAGVASELRNWTEVINKHRGIAMDKEILGMMSGDTTGQYFTNEDLLRLKEKYPHASTEELFKKLTLQANLKQRARMDMLTKAFDKYVSALPKGPESLTNADVNKFFQINDVNQEWEGPKFLEFLKTAVERGAHPRLSQMKHMTTPGGGIVGIQGDVATPIVEPAEKPVSVFNRKLGTKRDVPRVVADAMIATGAWTEGDPITPVKPDKTLEQIENEARARATGTAAGTPVKPESYAPDMQQFLNSMTGESIMVNVRNPQEAAAAASKGFSPISPLDRGYGVEHGKSSAERETQINTDSAKARVQVTTLQTLNQLLDRFETGKLGKFKLNLQQYANSFSLPVNLSSLRDKEAFNALTEQLALQSRNMGEGMVLAGHMSDKDVQFLRDMNPQLVLSRGGNKLLINIRMAIAKRSNEIAKYMRDFKKQSGGRFDATAFDDYLAQKFNKTSIFGIPEGAVYSGSTDKITGLPVYQTKDGRYFIPEF
uniref:Uncharacterized protein n=1 Tax=viral metagenome TaxID=1070528 RepID=A0A6M3KB14_9ZZZZ